MFFAYISLNYNDYCRYIGVVWFNWRLYSQTLGHANWALVAYIYDQRGLRSSAIDLKPREYAIYVLRARSAWPEVWALKHQSAFLELWTSSRDQGATIPVARYEVF